MRRLKILTFNWHEAYLHSLSRTGYDFDVVLRFKGGTARWMEEFRPVPRNFNFVELEDARRNLEEGKYDLVICHNNLDFADVADYRVPTVIVFHTLPWVIRDERGDVLGKEYFSRLVESLACHELIIPVFVSEKKRNTWGIDGIVIELGVDVNDYHNWDGSYAAVLRVGQFLREKDRAFGMDGEISKMLDGVDVTVLGINPDVEGARLSSSWEDLKENLSSHRVYLNTTYEFLDDGYNFAMLEALATGIPVVSIRNSTSPIVDGFNGFVSDDVDVLRKRVELLMRDPGLARTLGEMGKKTVERLFPLSRFLKGWTKLINEIKKGNCAGYTWNDVAGRKKVYSVPSLTKDAVAAGVIGSYFPGSTLSAVTSLEDMPLLSLMVEESPGDASNKKRIVVCDDLKKVPFSEIPPGEGDILLIFIDEPNFPVDCSDFDSVQGAVTSAEFLGKLSELEPIGWAVEGLIPLVDPFYAEAERMGELREKAGGFLDECSADERARLLIFGQLVRLTPRAKSEIPGATLEDEKTALEEHLLMHPLDISAMRRLAEICESLGDEEGVRRLRERIELVEMSFSVAGRGKERRSGGCR